MSRFDSLPVVEAWKKSVSEPSFLFKVLIIIFLATVEIFYLQDFMFYNEIREADVMHDLILDQLPAIDFSIVIFTLLYVSMITAVLLLIKYPHALINLVLAYGVLCIVRAITLYLVPLDPPVNYIPLEDPFLELIYDGRVLLKDLFFSGHTASVFICALTVPKKYRIYFYITTFAIGVLLLFQHIHYTIDVVAAPFFAYLSYQIVIFINGRFDTIRTDLIPLKLK